MDYEEAVKTFANEKGLSDKARTYLDSIAWQTGQVGRTPLAPISLVYQIASRYEDFEGALKLIDDSLDEFYRRGTGSLGKLDEEDAKALDSVGRVVLGGLQDRINEHFLCNTSRGVPGKISTGPREDDGGPWGQNVTRELENVR